MWNKCGGVCVWLCVENGVFLMWKVVFVYAPDGWLSGACMVVCTPIHTLYTPTHTIHTQYTPTRPIYTPTPPHTLYTHSLHDPSSDEIQARLHLLDALTTTVHPLCTTLAATQHLPPFPATHPPATHPPATHPPATHPPAAHPPAGSRTVGFVLPEDVLLQGMVPIGDALQGGPPVQVTEMQGEKSTTTLLEQQQQQQHNDNNNDNALLRLQLLLDAIRHAHHLHQQRCTERPHNNTLPNNNLPHNRLQGTGNAPVAPGAHATERGPEVLLLEERQRPTSETPQHPVGSVAAQHAAWKVSVASAWGRLDAALKQHGAVGEDAVNNVHTEDGMRDNDDAVNNDIGNDNTCDTVYNKENHAAHMPDVEMQPSNKEKSRRSGRVGGGDDHDMQGEEEEEEEEDQEEEVIVWQGTNAAAETNTAPTPNTAHTQPAVVVQTKTPQTAPYVAPPAAAASFYEQYDDHDDDMHDVPSMVHPQAAYDMMSFLPGGTDHAAGPPAGPTFGYDDVVLAPTQPVVQEGPPRGGWDPFGGTDPFGRR